MGWTILIIIALVVLVAALGLDVYLTTDKIDGNTFSELLREYGMKTPFFPWVLGALAGRWFHPGEHLQPLFSSQAGTYVAIIVVTAVVVGVGILYKVVRGNQYWIPPWIFVVAGLVLGGIVAPVSPPPA